MNTMLNNDVYVDFLMWRRVYQTACEFFAAGLIDETEFRRRAGLLGFTKAETDAEVQLRKRAFGSPNVLTSLRSSS